MAENFIDDEGVGNGRVCDDDKKVNIKALMNDEYGWVFGDCAKLGARDAAS